MSPPTVPMLRICGLATPRAAVTSDGNSARMTGFIDNSSSVTFAPMRTPAPVLAMPPSSAMPLILTTRLGVAMNSFIELIRSVPPASTCASFQLAPSRAVASFTVAGLAYSKRSILCVPPVGKSGQHAIRSQRQNPHPDADGVGHRVRDGGHAAHRRGFAEADDAPGVVFGRNIHVNQDLADVADAGQLVKFHVGVEHAAGLLIHDALL